VLVRFQPLLKRLQRRAVGEISDTDRAWVGEGLVSLLRACLEKLPMLCRLPVFLELQLLLGDDRLKRKLDDR